MFTWTGPYLGLAAGYAWGHSEIHIPGISGDQSLDPNGWLVGAFGGYNYQFGSGLVLGAEADIDWTGLDDNGTTAGIDFSTDMNWEASLRVVWVTRLIALSFTAPPELQLPASTEKSILVRKAAARTGVGRRRGRRLRIYRQDIRPSRIPVHGFLRFRQ